MNERNFGLKVNDRDGKLLIETGAHVLKRIPGFAELVGKIAAEWAQAETFLECYFAALQGTTPEKALRNLRTKNGEGVKPTRQIIGQLKTTAEISLSPDELETVRNLLERFELVRKLRNRLQHDLWSWKPNDESALYIVRAIDYLRLSMEVSETAKQPHLIANSIEMAQEYALTATNRITLEILERLRSDIRSVSIGFAKEFFSHINTERGEL